MTRELTTKKKEIDMIRDTGKIKEEEKEVDVGSQVVQVKPSIWDCILRD